MYLGPAPGSDIWCCGECMQEVESGWWICVWCSRDTWTRAESGGHSAKALFRLMDAAEAILQNAKTGG